MTVTKTSFVKFSFDLQLVDPNMGLKKIRQTVESLKLGHKEKWTSEKVGRRGFPFTSRNPHTRNFCTLKRREKNTNLNVFWLLRQVLF